MFPLPGSLPPQKKQTSRSNLPLICLICFRNPAQRRGNLSLQGSILWEKWLKPPNAKWYTEPSWMWRWSLHHRKLRVQFANFAIFASVTPPAFSTVEALGFHNFQWHFHYFLYRARGHLLLSLPSLHRIVCNRIHLGDLGRWSLMCFFKWRVTLLRLLDDLNVLF